MMEGSEGFEFEKWLDQAKSDIDDAEYLFKDGGAISAAFHVHQALEKAFKAYQIKVDGEHDYSHDLLQLVPADIEADYASLLADLNPVYTGTRYPNVSGSIEDVGEYIKEAKEVLEWIRKQLKE